MCTRLLKCLRTFPFALAIGLMSGCPGGGGGTGEGIAPDNAVVSTTPTNGATGVAADAVITVTFSRPGLPDSLDGSIQPDIDFTETWSTDGRTLTVTPKEPFTPGVEYTVTITDLQFTDGSRLAGPFSFSFTTGPGARMSLSEVQFWAYQIQRLEDDRAIDMIDELVASRYDLLVLEPTRSDRDNADFDTAGMVRRLHESPASVEDRTKLVVAYIDIGQAEDWRTYWTDEWVAPTAEERGSPDFLITIDPDGWSGNYPVAYWDQRWKDIMIDGENSVLQQVLDDGFDGIYMDWVEAYSDPSVMAVADGLALNPAQEMIGFIREIREYAQARNPDFLVIPQNAPELLEFGGQDYVDIIDGIAEEQIYYDGNADTEWDDADSGDHRVPDTCPADDSECGYSRAFYEGWLAQYQEADKVVLSVDYAADPANVAEAYENASANGYIPYVSRRPLDRLTDTPPTGLLD